MNEWDLPRSYPSPGNEPLSAKPNTNLMSFPFFPLLPDHTIQPVSARMPVPPLPSSTWILLLLLRSNFSSIYLINQ